MFLYWYSLINHMKILSMYKNTNSYSVFRKYQMVLSWLSKISFLIMLSIIINVIICYFGLFTFFYNIYTKIK